MLTGEYLALDNALVLTLPTKFGQTLSVEKTNGNGHIEWISYTNEEKIWFKARFKYYDNSIRIESENDKKIADTLVKIINAAIKLSPTLLQNLINYKITTHLEFPQNWGLGSSSTLINNIAQWFNINPFDLHFNVFNGSGYDIASAYNDNPVTYLINNQSPIVEEVKFNPPYKTNIFFVHLNQKQNSYNEVKKYQKNKSKDQIESAIKITNSLTNEILTAKTLAEFEKLLLKHEQTLAKVLGIPTIQKQLFNDYDLGVIKSLGAWGGDFVLVTGNEKSIEYFLEKGYQTILTFDDVIL